MPFLLNKQNSSEGTYLFGRRFFKTEKEMKLSGRIKSVRKYGFESEDDLRENERGNNIDRKCKKIQICCNPAQIKYD